MVSGGRNLNSLLGTLGSWSITLEFRGRKCSELGDSKEFTLKECCGETGSMTYVPHTHTHHYTHNGTHIDAHIDAHVRMHAFSLSLSPPPSLLSLVLSLSDTHRYYVPRLSLQQTCHTLVRHRKMQRTKQRQEYQT